jgi:hypothetical protein
MLIEFWLSQTGINHFPTTLKKLSLRGAKCYNLPLDKSFLFNIQDYLPELEVSVGSHGFT